MKRAVLLAESQTVIFACILVFFQNRIEQFQKQNFCHAHVIIVGKLVVVGDEISSLELTIMTLTLICLT
jgi:hypothetical protein